MPKRKKKADGDRSFAFLHQLTSYIVDRCNVISVHRMAKAKGISQKGGPEKSGLLWKATMAQIQAPMFMQAKNP